MWPILMLRQSFMADIVKINWFLKISFTPAQCEEKLYAWLLGAWKPYPNYEIIDPWDSIFKCLLVYFCVLYKEILYAWLWKTCRCLPKYCEIPYPLIRASGFRVGPKWVFWKCTKLSSLLPSIVNKILYT